MKARTGGEKGRHLRPRLVQKIAEGKNLRRVELESKSDDEKKREKKKKKNKIKLVDSI